MFEDMRLYDTSCLYYKDKAYYFKRIFLGDDSIQNNDEQAQTNGGGFRNQPIYSDLQLFSYDLKSDYEVELEKF